MTTVLVADDDQSIRASLSRALRLADYTVVLAEDGPSAIAAVAEHRPDACILDVMMPGLTGLDVTADMRARGDWTPILVLTARVEVGDRVAGLDAGADDYLAKPFELDELLARLRAVLRRAPERTARLEAYGIAVDTDARRASRGGIELQLTRIEFDLLALLVGHAGQVLDQSAIYTAVWGYDFGRTSKNLSVYVTYLRRKLEADGSPRLIHAVRGVGFVLRDTP